MIIGYLSGEIGGDFLVTPFRQALKDSGYIEGRNAAIEFRFPTVNTIECLRSRPIWFAAK
jgi:hypothetical protein